MPEPYPRRQRFSDLIPLRNPFILASGPPGRHAEGMIQFGRTAGAVVGKSATLHAQQGNPQPRIARVGQWGMINWEDLPNPGYKAFAEMIAQAKQESPAPIIGSIGPLESVDEQLLIAHAFEDAGADALELDFKWGAGFGDDLLSRLTGAIKQVVRIPVIVKLSPYIGDIVDNAIAAEQAGADAISAINTVYPAMKINVDTGKPALSFGSGGLSGGPILTIAVAAVYRIYKATTIPVLASGGVTCAEDALQHVMAGADAVQVCTAAMIEGPEVFTRLNTELDALLSRQGYSSLDECRGIAHQTALHVPSSATAKPKN